MSGGVAVAKIYVVNQLLLLCNVNGRQFSVVLLVILIMIMIDDQLMLYMFYLEERKIVACNMLAKLVDFKQLDFLSTIVERKSIKNDKVLNRYFKQTN